MAYRETKIIWTDENTNTFELEHWNDIRVTRVKDAKNNVCEIVLDNYGSNLVNSGSMRIKEGTTLNIYSNEGLVDTTDVNQLLGIFVVLNLELQPDNHTIKIICSDKTYKMLNTLYTRDITNTIDYIVNSVVQSTVQTGDTQDSVITDIVSTKSDGVTALPSKQYISVWKTAYDVLSEISQTDYTEDDRQFIFWFDPDETFHWTYQDTVPQAEEFIYGEDPVNTMKITKKEAESIKMLIFDAGIDLNDNQILNFYLDPNAGSIKSAIKYQPMLDIAKRLKTDTSITDNEVFRTQAILQAKTEAKKIMIKVGQGLWECVIDVEGYNYIPGKLYPVESLNIGFPKTNLRLDRVIHTINQKGWLTRLTLIEDPSEDE